MITLFTLSGTIAMSGASGGVVTRLKGAELARSVPGLAGLGITLDVRDALAVSSAGLSFGDILGVVERAESAVRDGATGVVVTQGTDTLEETAYLVDLVWSRTGPFVLTGAMRNPRWLRTALRIYSPRYVSRRLTRHARSVLWSFPTTRSTPRVGSAKPTPRALPRSRRPTRGLSAT